MTPEEEISFNAERERADNAERANAVARSVANYTWIDNEDAFANLTGRAVKQEDGSWLFTSTKKGEDGKNVLIDANAAAIELANAKPHWVKAKLTAGTNANGNAGSKAPGETTTYAELIKPQNAEKLKNFIANKPKELARLRAAHFSE